MPDFKNRILKDLPGGLRRKFNGEKGRLLCASSGPGGRNCVAVWVVGAGTSRTTYYKLISIPNVPSATKMTEAEYIEMITADGTLVEDEEQAETARQRCEKFLTSFNKKKS